MASKRFFLVFVVSVVSFSSHAQTVPVRHRITKDFAMDTIMRLPEIKDDNAYIKKVTKNKRHLFPIIYGETDRQRPYYWVVVGEDNGMSFVPHYHFYVYIKTGKIFYFDLIKDTAVDLRSWRKTRKSRSF